MADNYVQQDRTFWRRSQQDSNTGGSVTSQKDSRWNPEFQLHEIEVKRWDGRLKAGRHLFTHLELEYFTSTVHVVMLCQLKVHEVQ